MLMDPEDSRRVQARVFQEEQGVSRQTAEYYIWSFAGVDGSRMELAKQEYEAADVKDAPLGFHPPCDDHWLSKYTEMLAGLGGNCVAILCGGAPSRNAPPYSHAVPRFGLYLS